MRRKRLVVVSEYFWPDEASTGRLLAELVQQLDDKEEFDITVLTSDRLYRSTRPYQLQKIERWGSVKVIRTQSWRSGQDHFLRRLVSDIAFTVQCAWQVLHLQYDCLFVVTNPPLVPLVLSFLTRRTGKSWVYLIHDLYPDLPVALHIWAQDSATVRWLRKWQGRALQHASRVIVLGRCMKDYLVHRYQVQEDAVTVIPNWFTVDSKVGLARKQHEAFIVLYSGNLGQFQDFDTLLDAAEILKSCEGILFYFSGNGYRKDYIAEQIASRQLGNVVLTEFLPDAEFNDLLQRASLGVVTLEPEMEGLGVPSKSYNLLAMGIPLLVIMGAQAEIARVIAEEGCGVRVAHGQAQLLADHILHLSSHTEEWEAMRGRAYKYAHSNADLAVVAERYAQAINAAMGTANDS